MAKSGNSWFAVYTKPRQERVALEHLERQGFSCFLPMADNPYQRRQQKRRAEPLFPRYLFLNARPNQQSLAPVRSTRGVATLVRFGIKLANVPESVIRVIHDRIDSNTGLVKLDPVPVRPGETPAVDGSMREGRLVRNPQSRYSVPTAVKP